MDQTPDLTGCLLTALVLGTYRWTRHRTYWLSSYCLSSLSSDGPNTGPHWLSSYCLSPRDLQMDQTQDLIGCSPLTFLVLCPHDGPDTNLIGCPHLTFLVLCPHDGPDTNLIGCPHLTVLVLCAHDGFLLVGSAQDKSTCCHTEIDVAGQIFSLTQSQYTDTGPASPSTDPITPGTWQDSQSQH